MTCGNGVYGFTLDSNKGDFVLTNPDLKIPDEDGQKIFSGNLGNVPFWDPKLAG